MPEDTPLRDRLAIQRTELANERTLLAYSRTAIMLASTGAAVLKFYFHSPLAVSVSVVLIAGGLLTAGAGAARFFRVRRSLR